MLYRQELFGFGEPREGGWDGWQRINRETESGGLGRCFPPWFERHAGAGLRLTISILPKNIV
ncbi:MAG: hypothetical protein AB2L24_03275 [Mangrovibacterium sp.]